MRLNRKYYIQPVGDSKIAVCQESQNLIKLTDTGAFIFSLLDKETTEEAILNALCEEYDAPRETMEIDMREFISKLRKEGLLVE